jgi:hypothetical protein
VERAPELRPASGPSSRLGEALAPLLGKCVQDAGSATTAPAGGTPRRGSSLASHARLPPIAGPCPTSGRDGTQGTPRRYVAATNPATSVVVPRRGRRSPGRSIASSSQSFRHVKLLGPRPTERSASARSARRDGGGTSRARPRSGRRIGSGSASRARQLAVSVITSPQAVELLRIDDGVGVRGIRAPPRTARETRSSQQRSVANGDRRQARRRRCRRAV